MLGFSWAMGIWGYGRVGEVYPQAEQQLCWNHKMLNVMDAVSKKEQTEGKKHLNAMMYADSESSVEGAKEIRARL